MIKVTLVGDRELIARIAAIPTKMRAALVRKVSELGLRLEARVKGKLSGQVLNVQSGALRRSIFFSISENSSDAVKGKVASSGDVKYAGIHEFGGTINVPDIFPAKAKALHFFVGGREVFAKRVRAHTVTMPERSYLRSSLSEMQDEIVLGLKDAIRQGLNK